MICLHVLPRRVIAKLAAETAKHIPVADFEGCSRLSSRIGSPNKLYEAPSQGMIKGGGLAEVSARAGRDLVTGALGAACSRAGCGC